MLAAMTLASNLPWVPLKGVVEKQPKFLSFPGLNMSFAFYYSVVVTAILRI
jgi:hypothetical protein